MKRFGIYAIILVIGLILVAINGLANYRLLLCLLGGLACLLLVKKLASAGPGRNPLALRINPKFVLLAVSILISLGAAEAALQIFFFDHIPRIAADDPGGYRNVYDSTLGWFPVPNFRTPGDIPPGGNNSLGLRGHEFQTNSNIRIMFSGDSFVWGYNIDNVKDRFTDLIQARHPEWNVYNLGVLGYGTDQELLLQQRVFDKLNPRVVFLLFCSENDHENNSDNMTYGTFKPYYTTNATGLELHGIPVPASELSCVADHPMLSRSYLFRLAVRVWKRFTTPTPGSHPDPTLPLLLEMKKYLQSKGATLAVGLTAPDAKVEHLLQDAGIPWIDLNLSEEYRFPNDPSHHWTLEGNRISAERIDQFLLTNAVVSPLLR